MADILYLGRERTPRASASKIDIIAFTGWNNERTKVWLFRLKCLFLKKPKMIINLPVNDTIAAGHDSSSISFLRFLVRTDKKKPSSEG